MTYSQRFLSGLPFGWFNVVLMFGLATLTLVFSMIVTSRLRGGVDFGGTSAVVAKSAGLLAGITLLQFIPWGILIAGPVWLVSLMYFFSLEYREARTLTKVNWGMNCLWKVLLLLWMV